MANIRIPHFATLFVQQVGALPRDKRHRLTFILWDVFEEGIRGIAGGDNLIVRPEVVQEEARWQSIPLTSQIVEGSHRIV